MDFKNNEDFDITEIDKFLVSRFKSYEDFKKYANSVSPSVFGTIQPKNKKELKRIIRETITKEGNECDLNFIDTSLITDMSGLFEDMPGFNGKIDKWDTSNVTDMSNMFHHVKSFNQPIGNWNTSKVTDMGCMFRDAKKFNQPIGDWNVSSVERTSGMFECATSFNQPIDKWDVSNVTKMHRMFEDAKLEMLGKIPSWHKE